MNLSDFNPITAVLGKVADVAQKYFPSEQERAKFIADVEQASREAQTKLEQIAADDRKSARDMQMATRSVMPAVLALLITAGFFGFLFYLMEYEPPAASRDILNIMLGSLGTAWIAVVSYYFGSTAGSAAKTALLGRK